MQNSTFLKLALLILLITSATSRVSSQKYMNLKAVTSDEKMPLGIFDGNTGGSGWQDAGNTDIGWLVVDLGETKVVGAIKIFWEAANAKEFNMSFSTDGVNFSGQMDFIDMAAGNRIDIITIENTECRFLKFQGVTRQLPYGYHIYEFEVYAPYLPELTYINVTPANAKVGFGEDLQFAATGRDQIGLPFNLTETTIWGVVDELGLIGDQGLFSATKPGYYTVRAANSAFNAEVNVEVIPENQNIAIGKSPSALTGNAQQAFDGNQFSRWESQSSDSQWIMIDLEKNYTISDMIIHWEGANAKKYIIESSHNGTDWRLVMQKENMPNMARYDRMYELSFNARYIRLTGIERNTAYGYSIWEWQIFGYEEEPVITDEIIITAENNEPTIDTPFGERQLFAEIMPTNTSYKAIVWSVNDETIATIDQNGLLTALNNGDVTVTAKALDGTEVKGSIKISITNQPILSLELIVTTENDDTFINTPGGTLQLGATIIPLNATNQIVQWEVDNESIATIDQNGLLKALSNGNITVTAKALDGTEVKGSILISITKQLFMNIQTDHLTGVSIFPNPAKESIFIVSFQTIENIHITSINGQRVKTISTHRNGNPIDIVHLPAGIYIVTVIDTKGQSTVQKMIKE